MSAGGTVGKPAAGGAGAVATGGMPAGTAAVGGMQSPPPTAAGAGAAGAAGMLGSAGTGGAGSGSQAGASGMSSAGAGAGAPGNAMEVWVSTTGADTNPGTQASPFASLAKAVSVMKPGMTAWVVAGDYMLTETIKLAQKGSEQMPFLISAAVGGDPDARPRFDFSAQPRGQSSARGLSISGEYWHVKGLELMKAGDNCIHISGSHNTIENVATHGCDDTGIQITADGSEASDNTRAAYNTILNCDSYENYDSGNQGENADGFAAKLFIGPGNVFRGCRAWNNSDDGWDLFASDDVVTIENCWAIANGKIGPSQNNTNGDGNGFKLGGAAKEQYQGGAEHIVKNCASIGNHACGYTLNNNTKTPKLSMCGGQGDGKGTFCSLSSNGMLTFTTSAKDAIAAKRKPDGSLPDL